MNAIETTELNGYTLNIYRDEWPMNPRKWEDNIGILYVPQPPRGCHFSDNGANNGDAMLRLRSFNGFPIMWQGTATITRSKTQPGMYWKAAAGTSGTGNSTTSTKFSGTMWTGNYGLKTRYSWRRGWIP